MRDKSREKEERESLERYKDRERERVRESPAREDEIVSRHVNGRSSRRPSPLPSLDFCTSHNASYMHKWHCFACYLRLSQRLTRSGCRGSPMIC